MRLVLLFLVAAFAIGFASGGRLGGLSHVQIRWAPLAVVGFGLQFFTPSAQGWPYALLILSFILLTVFAVANIKIAGFALILAGLLMNFAVIGANRGMPVTENALVGSGQQDLLTYLIEQGGAKHHLSGPDDELMFLADVIPLPPPIAQAVSLGDLVAYTGVGVVVVAAMRTGRRRRAAKPAEPAERDPAGDGSEKEPVSG